MRREVDGIYPNDGGLVDRKNRTQNKATVEANTSCIWILLLHAVVVVIIIIVRNIDFIYLYILFITFKC